MTIIERIKSEIMSLTPEIYRDAMLMRFGFTDGVTHSREDVCNTYNLDPDKAMILEKMIIKNVFKTT